MQNFSSLALKLREEIEVPIRTPTWQKSSVVKIPTSPLTPFVRSWRQNQNKIQAVWLFSYQALPVYLTLMVFPILPKMKNIELSWKPHSKG